MNSAAPACSQPLLYTYRRCPYAMRARMALLVAGVAFDAHEIVLRKKPSALLEASPKGTVPVLVLPDGQVLEQSWDIVRWALTQPGRTDSVLDWWSRAQSEANDTLLRLNDGAFKHHLDRYKYPDRFSNESRLGIDETRGHHRAQAVEVLLKKLETRLTEAAFLGGQSPCATDIGLFPFVRQFAAVDPPWFDALPLPRLKPWLSHWLGSPLFATCMRKLPPDVRVPFDTSLSGRSCR